MSDTDKPKCESGSEAHALFRRADAEHRKVEEAARWRVLFERLVAIIERMLKTKE